MNLNLDFRIPDDLTSWPPEDDDKGPVEYKSKIDRHMDAHKFNRLVTQMKWRLRQGAELVGSYKAIYVLGLYDDGTIADIEPEEMRSSIDTVEEISHICGAQVTRYTFLSTIQGSISILHLLVDEPRITRFPLLEPRDENEADDLVIDDGYISPDCLDLIDESGA